MEDVNLMREFVRLVECKNFSQVARELYVSQPTVTKHVQRLEQEFGCTLVRRDTRSVSVTEEGMLVHDAFADILSRFDELNTTLDERSQGIQGTIRLGVLYHGVAELALPVVTEFARQYPSIHVEFVSGQNDDMIRGLIDGSLDAAIVFKKEATKQFNLAKIRRYPLMCAIRDDNPLALHDSVKLGDTAGMVAKVLTNEYEHAEEMLTGYDIAGFEPVGNIDEIPHALAGRNSFSVLSSIMEGKLGEELVLVPFEVPVGEDVFCLACLPNNVSISVDLLMKTTSELQL